MCCTVVVTGVGECMNRLRSPGPALVCPCPPLQCTLHTADIVYIACHIYELHNALSTVYCTRYSVPVHYTLYTVVSRPCISVSLPTQCPLHQTVLLLHSSHSEEEWCPPSQGQSGRRSADSATKIIHKIGHNSHKQIIGPHGTHTPMHCFSS